MSKSLGYMPEQVQDFYPTPATVSTIDVLHRALTPAQCSRSTCPAAPMKKNMQRALLQYQDPKNYRLALEALHAAHREDLIGTGPGCLLPPPGAKRAAPVKKPKTTRPVPEKRLHKAKRHR